jgi:hypothetical protein
VGQDFYFAKPLTRPEMDAILSEIPLTAEGAERPQRPRERAA